MAWCLTAPSHYLNQCWLITKGALWHSPECNFARRTHELNPKNVFGEYIFRTTTTYPRGHWINAPDHNIHCNSYYCVETAPASVPESAAQVVGQGDMTDIYPKGHEAAGSLEFYIRLALGQSIRCTCCQSGHDANFFIVRRAGLIWSQRDFEWWWSVPLSSASLY